MDEQRFDNLTRLMASGMSRRGMLRSLGRGLAGLIAGSAALRREPATADNGLRLDVLACLGLTPKLAAQVCIALNLPHVAKTGCVNGRCAILACQPGWANCDGQVQTGCETPLGTRENCSICGDGCGRLDDTCHAGACAGGRCVAQPANVGGSCDDGNLCTVNDVCLADGSCAGTPKGCSSENDPCNDGVCRTSDGACIKQPKTNGTGCNDGNPCTVGDVCTNGVCAGTGKNCSSENDSCNTGVCRASDGACVKQPRANGIACNADNDSCTVGDSCQNGVCTPGTGTNCASVADQCNDGVCNPQTGACEKRPKSNGTGCNADNNACTVNDTCQNGTCVAGQPMPCPTCQTCVGGSCAPFAGDPRCATVCCGQICCAPDQICSGNQCTAPTTTTSTTTSTTSTTTSTTTPPPCSGCTTVCCNGTCCAPGEECEGGVCQTVTCDPACPPCQACFNGVCQPVASDPLCATCCAGGCCAFGEQCVGTTCQAVCSPLAGICEDAGGCCPSELEEADCQLVCNANTTCCHFIGGSCVEDCDCCDGGLCRGERCCVLPGGSCGSDSDCCLTGFDGECQIDGAGDGTCVAFCRGPNAECSAPEHCCTGDQCIDGRCRPPGCLPVGYRCAEFGECCQTEQTFCGDVGGAEPACCHPIGGSCENSLDCCEGNDCRNGVCSCLGYHGDCTGGRQCCSGFECRYQTASNPLRSIGLCRPVACSEALEGCNERPCCTGDCTRVPLRDGYCCSLEGEECHDLGRFFPGGDCCGSNVCNGAGACAPCRKLGESCDGTGTFSNCCNSVGGSNPLACQEGQCVPCTDCT